MRLWIDARGEDVTDPERISLALFRALTRADSVCRARALFGRDTTVILEGADAGRRSGRLAGMARDLMRPLRLLRAPELRCDKDYGGDSTRTRIPRGEVIVEGYGSTLGSLDPAVLNIDSLRSGLLESAPRARLLATDIIAAHLVNKESLGGSSIPFRHLRPVDPDAIVDHAGRFCGAVRAWLDGLERGGDDLPRLEVLSETLEPHIVALDRFFPHEVARFVDIRVWRCALRDCFLPARAGSSYTGVDAPLEFPQHLIERARNLRVLQVKVDEKTVARVRVVASVAAEPSRALAAARGIPAVQTHIGGREIAREIVRPTGEVILVTREHQEARRRTR